MARALGLRNRDSGRRGWGVSEKKERNREVKKEKKRKRKKKKTSRLIRDMVKIGKTFYSETTRRSCEAALPSPVVFGVTVEILNNTIMSACLRQWGMTDMLFFFCLIFHMGHRPRQVETPPRALSVTRKPGAVANL